MYSVIVIALIACSNGVLSYTVPTTVPTTPPPTTPPPVCHVDGMFLAVGQTYEDKHAGNEMCRVYYCDQNGNGPPFAYSHFACYDSTTDNCVNFYSTQILNGCERVCEPYTSSGGPGWVSNGCDTTLPPTTAPQGCLLGGNFHPYGDIPNSGGCMCDYSGYVICP